MDSQSRGQVLADVGVRLRFSRSWGNEEFTYKHIFTPRLGNLFRGGRHGTAEDDWVDLGFEDARADLRREQQALSLGFNTSLSRNGRSLLSADLNSFWSWREEDREITRELGRRQQRIPGKQQPANQRQRPCPLESEPLLSANSRFTYNFVERLWTDLSASLKYTPNRHLQLSWSSVLIPESDRNGIGENEEDWEHTARAMISGQPLHPTGGGVTMRPLGRSIDVINLSLSRRFTDGEWSVFATYGWDEDRRQR